MLRRLGLGQRGDTIVEVMVVLAVLGLAVGISYATANASLLDARQAQESSLATELVQTQAENLRTLATKAPTDPDYIFQPAFQTTPFCVYVDNSNGHIHVDPDTTSSNCSNIDSLYNLTIKYTPISPSSLGPGGTFSITATWDDIRGQGKDTVSLIYRYYQQ